MRNEKLFSFVLVAFFAALLAEPAHAGFAEATNSMVSWFSGNLAKGLATLAIIFLGVGALFGKIEWKNALTTGVGIAAVFGAGSIYNSMGLPGGGGGAGGALPPGIIANNPGAVVVGPGGAVVVNGDAHADRDVELPGLVIGDGGVFTLGR